MLPVLRTEQAEADLTEILDYLDEHSAQAADRLVLAIDERCRLLGEFPEMGRRRDELIPGLRSVVAEKYVLFYRVTATAVEVVRILHGARDIHSILKTDGPPAQWLNMNSRLLISAQTRSSSPPRKSFCLSRYARASRFSSSVG